MSKFTFKKQPKEAGLAAVGNGTPSVDIKLNKKIVGTLHAPNWMTKDGLWKIMFTVKGNDSNPNCDWRWYTLKKRCQTEEECREFVNKHFDAIVALGLHELEYD